MKVMPATPSKRFFEMSVRSGSDGRPLSVAKHINEIQVGSDHRFEISSKNELFNCTTPVSKSLHRPRKADAPLMYAETRLAKLGAMLVNQMFGVTRS